MKITVYNKSKLPTCNFNEFLEIQGDFKISNPEQEKKLQNTILKRGFKYPFVIWIDKDKKYTIDANQRLKALKSLQKDGYEIPDIPYYEIEAKNKKEAVEEIAYINSQYADINPETTLFEIFDIELADLDIEIAEFENFEEIEISEIKERKVKVIETNKEIDEIIAKTEKIYFSFSGGRDSCLAIMKTLKLFEGKEKLALFVETGVEFPDLRYFIYKFCNNIGLPLKILHPKKDFFELYGNKKIFPDPIFRDCIFRLINDVLDKFIEEDSEGKSNFIVRGGRKKQKRINHKLILKGGKMVFMNENKILFNPIYDLTKEEFDEEIKNIDIWTGYSKGFERTACWTCPFQKKQQYIALKKYYPFLWENMQEMAKTWLFPEHPSKKTKKDTCKERFLNNFL